MGRELQTTVVLNGRATSGFTALADKVTQLGYVISQVGGKVGEWEKESLETYKNYETYMLEAKGAMSATAKSASELERNYDDLNKKAQEWAGNTIFHTNDVAKAISEAAHAGWDYEKMLQGIPQAMVLAQAGNTDLSSGLDMLIKTINGTGIAFENSGEFVDQWVMAANSSATTVSELGEAMEKMGATARFGNSTGELLTMLAVLANTGTVGSAAGTLLRNSMIRLIAPTKNAREAMEGLGVEADEISEAVGSDSEALAEANEMLTKAGFSAYTTEGKLKPFLETFKDLYKATAGMSEADRNKVLSAIFPTRTITGAMALLQAAADDYDGLLEKITNSEGYAAKVAGIQTSGLMGSEELFKSKWEEFSRKIGEILSEPVEDAYSILGGFIDTLNSADPTILSAITGAATALSVAGPGLVALGIGMKLFSFIGPYGTAILAAVVGLGALYGYLDKMNKLALENNFGTLAIDMESINGAIETVNSDLSGALGVFNDYGSAAKQAAADYMAAGQTLTENLWSKMVTNKELTEEDKLALQTQADTLATNMETYLQSAFAEKVELASLIFSKSTTGTDSDADLAGNPVYASVLSLLQTGYDAAISEAQAKSAELRAAMTSAFADGKLTEAEVRNIQEIMAQINELMAGLSPTDLEFNKLLNKSQRVSLESMKEFSGTVQEAKEKAFAETDAQMDDLAAYMRVLYNQAIKNGTGFINPVTGQWVDDATQIDIDALIATTQEQYEMKRTAWGTEYDKLLMRGWQNALATSDTGALFTEAQGYLTQAQNGLMTFAQAEKLIADSMSGDQNLLGKSLDTMIEYYGGVGEMAKMVENYRKLGGEDNLAMANWLEQMITMREAVGGNVTGANLSEYQPEERKSNWNMTSYLADIYNNGEGQEELLQYYAGLSKENKKAWDDTVDALRNQYDLAEIGRAYDKNGGEGLSNQVLEWLGAYVVNNASQGRPGMTEALKDYSLEPEVMYERAMAMASDAVTQQQAKITELQEKQNKIAADIETRQTRMENRDYAWWDGNGYHNDWEALYGKNGDGSGLLGQQNEVNIDIAAAQAELATLQGELDELAGHPPIQVDAEAKLDSSEVDSWVPPAKYQWVYYRAKDETDGGGNMPKKALGGRATEPSIFGEVPGQAEWAIPEAHTQRTAELLKAAAAASGFTWGELLATNGGLNAGGGISVTISSYAPVINAGDARGVAEELAKDKARLGDIVKKAVQSAIENMNLHDSIEVYA